MYLEKAYNKFYRGAMLDMIIIYWVGWHLLEESEEYYNGVKSCVRVEGDISEDFNINVRLRQDVSCLLSSTIYIWMNVCVFLYTLVKNFQLHFCCQSA